MEVPQAAVVDGRPVLVFSCWADRMDRRGRGGVWIAPGDHHMVLAKDFPGDAVALMAVTGRVSLLSVDLIMGLMFAPFAPRKT